MLKRLREKLIEKLEKISLLREQIVKRFTRSSGWNRLRKEHLKKFPYCAVCGKKKNLQVHHIMPFKEMPEKELDPNNLITLCARHHFTFGHCENWKTYNPTVVEDCAYWRIKFERAKIIDGRLDT